MGNLSFDRYRFSFLFNVEPVVGVDRKHTILHLSSTSGIGGAEMIVLRLAASLDRSRFRSVVCLFRPGWLNDSCREAGLPTHVIKMRGALDFNWAQNFARLIRQEEIAVIHAHEFTANSYGSLMGQILGVGVRGKQVVDFHRETSLRLCPPHPIPLPHLGERGFLRWVLDT